MAVFGVVEFRLGGTFDKPPEAFDHLDELDATEGATLEAPEYTVEASDSSNKLGSRVRFEKGLITASVRFRSEESTGWSGRLLRPVESLAMCPESIELAAPKEVPTDFVDTILSSSSISDASDKSCSALKLFRVRVFVLFEAEEERLVFPAEAVAPAFFFLAPGAALGTVVESLDAARLILFFLPFLALASADLDLFGGASKDCGPALPRLVPPRVALDGMLWVD